MFCLKQKTLSDLNNTVKDSKRSLDDGYASDKDSVKEDQWAASSFAADSQNLFSPESMTNIFFFVEWIWNATGLGYAMIRDGLG